ncbi:MAG: serine hydrolase domain-containing protein [Bryobacteraceae bacterium]
MRLALTAALLGSLLHASDAYPPARFTDPQRTQKLEAAMPEVDQIFQQFAADRKIPGMVWGVVIDGRLAHVASTGVRDRASGAKVDGSTVFRIASMTKSFTALAILKLRDEGRLSLEDPVSKWIPEFAAMPLPTRDTAPLRVRNLLSHSAGFPEDNPWGDQQLSASDADLTRWLKLGIPFSTPPDTRYEYSNYAFGLLGRIVTKASGVPFDKYVQREILATLGMTASTLEFSTVPAATRAHGYRLQPDGTYLEEAPLPHGVFGAMGGMLTNASDLGKYVAFHLSAWPARDDAESGPVRRSSVREMNHLWRPANLTAARVNGAEQVSFSGYGYGLRITTDCRFEMMVGHGGGLPGFGSYMTWLPDYGVGFFAMANLTYVGPSAPISKALDVFLKTGGLQKRELPASPILTSTREHIWSLWNKWDDAEAKKVAAMNFFLDTPLAQRRGDMERLKEEVGGCSAAGPVRAENWLRGQFNMTCEKGTVGVFFTMAPTQPPTMQHLEFRTLENDGIRMGAPTGAPAGVSCKE